MAISRARKNFRYFLFILLAISTAFAGTSTYYYLKMKQDRSILREIGPTLFRLDIYAHQAKMMFQDDNADLKTALKLYQKGLFSRHYAQAGLNMIHDLSEKGHAGAQTVHANILLLTPVTPEEHTQAMALYTLAAAQNYEPAINRLALLTATPPP